MPDEAEAFKRLEHLIKAMGYGQAIITVAAGKPTEVQVLPQVRLDKPLWPGVMDLIGQGQGGN